jgi:hypothetical protein
VAPAVELACLVQGDGGRDDIAAWLAAVPAGEKDALLVVLAALVDTSQRPCDLLSWLTFDETGRPMRGGPVMEAPVRPERPARKNREAAA